MTSRATAVGLAFAVAAMVGGSAVASASTISGPLTGVKLPAKGKGVASVRAISPKTFAIVGADRVRGGRFSLTVPAGAYFLLGTTTPFRGKGGVDRSVATVKVGKGARKTVRLSLKARRKKRPALPAIPQLPGFPPKARAAFVHVDYPAVALRTYKVTVADPQFQALGNGLPDMLTTDLLEPLKARCNGALVERRRFDVIVAEHALQQSPLVDPATRIQFDKIIAYNKNLTGTIAGTADNLTITSTVTDLASGKSRSVSHHGTRGFFALEKTMAPDLVKLVCGEKPPAGYVGTIQGEYGIAEHMLRWAGTVRLKFIGFGPGGAGAPDGKYALYVVADGSLHVTFDGVDGDCTLHGAGDYPLVGNLGQFATLQQDVDERAYTLEASFTNGTDLPYLSTGAPGCTGAVYPLSGRVYLNTQSAKTSPSNSLAGSSTVDVGVPITWTWALEPV